jgi:uncharacterized protein
MTESQPAGTASRPWRRVLFGASGLRAGWRLLLFFAMFYLLTGSRNAVIRRVGGLDGAALYVFNQATRFLFCLIASALMGRFEGRSIAGYGLPWHQAFRLRFWQGKLIGFVTLSTLLGVMGLAGVFHLGSIAISGAAIWKYGAAYALICLIIGFSEEFFYRGYVQFTPALRRSDRAGVAARAPARISVDRSEPSRRQLMVMAFSFVLLVSIVSTTALPSSATTKRL